MPVEKQSNASLPHHFIHQHRRICWNIHDYDICVPKKQKACQGLLHFGYCANIHFFSRRL